MRDSGDVCGARNTQFEQEFFGLFLGETVSAYNWRDRIGDFCVADYLAKLDTMHVMRYSTRFGLHLRRKGSGASTCCFEKRRRRARRSSSCTGRQRQTVHRGISCASSITSAHRERVRRSRSTESNWKTWFLSRSRSSQTKAAVTHTPPLRSCSSRAMVNSWQS
jgi:hypothetical protein